MSHLLTRQRAIEILTRVERDHALLSSLLRQSARDERLFLPLLQKLVKGTISWRTRIRDFLESTLDVPFASLPPKIGHAFELATYQLHYLETIQRQIVVRETQLVLEDEEFPDLQKHLNALFLALKKPAPAKETSTKELSSDYDISREYSHPEWLVANWRKQLGVKETIELCEANNRPWPVAIRTNLLKITPERLSDFLFRDRVRTKPSEYLREFLVIGRMPKDEKLTRLDAFREGLFQVQDESAGVVGYVLDPKPGESIIDLCAAPGGKSTHAAMLMRNRGRILALDTIEDRLHYIDENCHRLGIRIVNLRAEDARDLKIQNLADRVLLDAPCSGFGVLGRKSDVKWAKDEETVAELVQLQDELLDAAAKLVRVGGSLVYSTCTTIREENEDRVVAFLERHKNFEKMPLPEKVPKKLISKEGFVRTWPHRHGIGGSFAALLKRVRE